MEKAEEGSGQISSKLSWREESNRWGWNVRSGSVEIQLGLLVLFDEAAKLQVHIRV